MKINDVLSQIDLGNYALPEFQRGYVWTRSDVRKLMYSLYRDYPVGSLLVWDTETVPDMIRGDGKWMMTRRCCLPKKWASRRNCSLPLT